MERASEREKSLALCMTCEWPCNCCAHGRAAAHGPVTCATAAASEVKRASTFSYHAHAHRHLGCAAGAIRHTSPQRPDTSGSIHWKLHRAT